MASLYDRISRGKMTVDEITESMRYATSEGGRFFQSMEKQSQTLNGQLSTLRDNADQLLGSLAEGVSEGLRDQILPFANNLIAELQAAFDTGGYQGLVDKATDMIPDLLGMMTGNLQQGIDGLVKWLPQGANKLMQALPSVLRASTTVMPQLTQALFEIAGSIMGDLVAMLPELAPMVGEGLWNLFISAGKGAISAVDSIGEGMVKALKEMGVIAPTAAEAFQGMVDSVDDATKKRLSEQVSIDLMTNVTTDDYQAKIDGAIEAIENALKGIPGLTEGEQAEIKNAILHGTGLDVIQLALDEAGIDPTVAVGAINGARESINAAIAGLGLDEEATAHLQNLIGNNATPAQIQQAIESFGIDGGVAAGVTATITGEMDTLSATLAGLGIPPTTIATLKSGLFTDRQLIIAAMQMLGLPEETVNSIIQSYDTAAGTITAGIDGIYKRISEMFTDGKSETPDEIKGIKDQIYALAQDAYTQIDGWYDEAIKELNSSGLTGEAYQRELESIEGTYASLTEGVKANTEALLAQTEGMVGQSTEYCKGQVEIMSMTVGELKDLTAQIDMLTSADMKKGRQSRDITIAGITQHEGTQLEAILTTYTEYTNKILAAQKDFDEEIAAAQEAYAAGTMTKEEYDAAEEAANARLKQAESDAMDYYQQYIDMILAGIMKADPAVAAAIESATPKLGASKLADSILESIKSATQDGEKTLSLADFMNIAGLTQEDLQALADGLGQDVAVVEGYLKAALAGDTSYFGSYATDLQEAANAQIVAALTGGEFDFSKTTGTLSTAIANGWLLPGINGIDYTNVGAIFEGHLVAALAVSDTTTAAATGVGETLMDAAASGAAGSESTGKGLGNDFAKGYIDGVNAKYNEAYNAGVKLANAARLGVKNTQISASPSKVARGLGGDFGDGYSIGLQESLAKAVAVAKRMTGQVVTAADISRSMKVSMPSLQQDIIMAYEQADRGVNLYVNGRELGRVMASDTRMAQNRYNRSVALGVGKK